MDIRAQISTVYKKKFDKREIKNLLYSVWWLCKSQVTKGMLLWVERLALLYINYYLHDTSTTNFFTEKYVFEIKWSETQVKVFSSKFSHDLCCEYIIPWKYICTTMYVNLDKTLRTNVVHSHNYNIYLKRNSKKCIDASPEAYLKDFDVVVSVLHYFICINANKHIYQKWAVNV